MGRQGQLMGYNLVGFWGMGVALGWWLTFKVGRHTGTHTHRPELCMWAAAPV